MSAMAGDLPSFEEASRALFADDRRRFAGLIADWPADIRDHIVKLAYSDRAASAQPVLSPPAPASRLRAINDTAIARPQECLHVRAVAALEDLPRLPRCR